MDISNSFYSNWATSEEPNYYLYVSKKDTLLSALKAQRKFKYFGFNLKEAKKSKRFYDEKQFSTLLYKTYGTSAAQLSNHLLSYSVESVSFIVFHEAIHQHIRINTKLPYSLTEAMCDIIGNYASLAIFKQNIELNKIKVKEQIEKIEDVSL
jgi:hypothetical protein